MWENGLAAAHPSSFGTWDCFSYRSLTLAITNGRLFFSYRLL